MYNCLPPIIPAVSRDNAVAERTSLRRKLRLISASPCQACKKTRFGGVEILLRDQQGRNHGSGRQWLSRQGGCNESNRLIAHAIAVFRQNGCNFSVANITYQIG